MGRRPWAGSQRTRKPSGSWAAADRGVHQAAKRLGRDVDIDDRLCWPSGCLARGGEFGPLVGQGRHQASGLLATQATRPSVAALTAGTSKRSKLGRRQASRSVCRDRPSSAMRAATPTARQAEAGATAAPTCLAASPGATFRDREKFSLTAGQCSLRRGPSSAARARQRNSVLNKRRHIYRPRNRFLERGLTHLGWEY